MSIVDRIVENYQSENPGVRANLFRLLDHGSLAGTGKLLILPVDQGFEHGPDPSFSANPDAYNPEYHFQIAIDGGLSAFAAPLGMLEDGAAKYSGKIPLILKMNSANSLAPKSNPPDQALYADIKSALRLGCVGVGFTIYPGSDNFNSMVERIVPLIQEAKSLGLLVVIWSYPRGISLAKEDEIALDVVSYAAHMACLLGAHIIKVKLPSAHIFNKSIQYSNIDILANRVRYVVRACFAGKRVVVFSGGPAKTLANLYEEIKAIREGMGHGSIIGRNTFSRPKVDALHMLNEIIEIYKSNTKVSSL